MAHVMQGLPEWRGSQGEERAVRVVGVLSGTSVDAIDVAVADLALDDGVVRLRAVGHVEVAWPEGLAARVLAVLPPASTTVAELCALDNDLGRAFAGAAVEAIGSIAGGRADLVASLGQTVFHDVVDGVCRGTLQLGQPAWIAAATGLPVVSDLRAADVAAGGHGAPLASTLDAMWLAPPRAALNIGGIANVTVVTDRVLAFDTGPGNCLLDLATERQTGARYDADGALAATGTVDERVLARLRAHPYFAAPPPKSTGRELFDVTYLDGCWHLDPADLLATLTELTASTIADALTPYRLDEVVVSGGGLRNPVLMAALRRRLDVPCTTSADHGIPPDAKEAYLVALLGALTWWQLPGTVPSATGASHPTTLGRITPPPPTAPLPPRLTVS